MDTSRLSIARLLELDVPFDWQDAVAVVQEVAMLSDVHAAMYNRPSLVSPEHCYITRAGSVELPETTEAESPEAVPDLLRALLAGREAPEALEDLAFGMATRDMSGELAAFPVGNRRAVIAKLAARALTVMTSPPAAGRSPQPPPLPISGAPEGGAWVPSAPSVAPLRPQAVDTTSHAQDAAALARETFRPVLVQPAARAPYVGASDAPSHGAISPPFVATPPFTATPPAPPATPAPGLSASEIELQRLRARTTTRLRGPGWTERLATLVAWRPAFPDPRVLGSAAIVTAAIVSMVWRGGSAPPPPASVTGPPPASLAIPALGERPGSGPPTTPATRDPLERSGNPPAVAASARGDAPANLPAAARPTGATPGRSPAAVSNGSAARASSPRIALPTASRPPAIDAAVPAASLPGTLPSVSAPALRVEPARPAAAEPMAAPPVPEATDDGEPRTGRPLAVAEPDAPAGALYTSGDAGVVPPVIRRQHLPSNLVEPMAEVPEDWPYLELLIDARGAVEQVRLHARQLAPGQTLYRHRMLLAAAKAWQFEPARRNGEAVRYLMRVPLEP